MTEAISAAVFALCARQNLFRSAYLIENFFAGWNELKELLNSLTGIFIAEPAVIKLMSLLAACPDITLRTVAYLNTFCSKTAHTVDIGRFNRSSVHFRPLYRSFFPQCLVIGSVCDECGTFSTDDTARSNYSAHGLPFKKGFSILCKPDG